MNHDDAHPLEKRVRLLETKLARVKRAGVTTAVVFAAIALVAAASPSTILEATRFVLRDQEGGLRGDWSADSAGARLMIYDGQATPRVAVVSDSSGASIKLFDDSAQLRVTVSAGASSQGIGVFDANRVARIGLGTNAAGPALGLFDEQGRPRASVVPLPIAVVENAVPSFTFDMGEFQTILNEGKGRTYTLRARVLLSTDKDRSDASIVKRELIERKAELRDAVNIVMLGVSPESFAGDAAGRKKSYIDLRDTIRAEINALLKNKIDGVFIEEFIFQ